MLVEDDLALGHALKDHFERNNYQIIWAKDADDAVANISVDVSLMFLDIKMPGSMDGFDLLKKIKDSASPYKEIEVIVLTNLGEIEEMDKARDFGADDYIIKSNIDLQKLLEYTIKKIGND